MEIKDLLKERGALNSKLFAARQLLDEALSAQRALEDEIKRIEGEIEAEFKETGESKIELDGLIYQLGYTKGRESVQVSAPIEDLPPEFITVREVKSVNKTAIASYLKNNKANFAQIVRGDDKFKIKVKA